MIRKRAGIYGDVAGSMVGDAFVPLSSKVGYIAGLLDASKHDDKDIKEMNKSLGLSFIPGVGSYRIAKKRYNNAVKNNADTATANIVGERWGGLTSTLIGALAGAGIGIGAERIITGKTPSDDSFVGGALVGASAPVLAAAALALINRRRTKAEQKEHDQSSNISNWLIPGMATYNKFKRMGRIHAEEIGEK